MKNQKQLTEEIEKRLLACGYESVGIIPLDRMEGFSKRYAERITNVPESRKFYERGGDISDLRKRNPWAKTIVVCTYYYGQYKYPNELRGRIAKAFALDQDETIFQRRKEFELWLESQGIRYEDRDTGPLRYAAVMAGLGIFRRNNFFYTEKGSYYNLAGYLLDVSCEELTRESNVRPCSEKCTRCFDACLTGALRCSYTLNPFRCVSFLTYGMKGILPEDIPEDSLQEWVCGCDNCQDACPYNHLHDWDEGKDYGGLKDIAPLFTPEGILTTEENVLDEYIEPITSAHLMRGEVPVLRRNAERALRFLEKVTD